MFVVVADALLLGPLLLLSSALVTPSFGICAVEFAKVEVDLGVPWCCL